MRSSAKRDTNQKSNPNRKIPCTQARTESKRCESDRNAASRERAKRRGAQRENGTRGNNEAQLTRKRNGPMVGVTPQLECSATAPSTSVRPPAAPMLAACVQHGE